MRITINSEVWTVNLISDLEYHANHGRIKDYATIAYTEYNHKYGIRKIHLSQMGLNRSTIVHELMHAYLSYSNFGPRIKAKTNNKIAEEMEEMIVESLCGKLPTILKLATKILDNFSSR